jgi:hypothetical protein
MATTGTSASDCGDELHLDTVQPAWPQSKPVLEVEGGDKLLAQQGYLITGQSAAEDA